MVDPDMTLSAISADGSAASNTDVFIDVSHGVISPIYYMGRFALG